ncbi:MAG: SRPBCC domain-containing protein, partial [Actinomycetota bacterium]
MRHAIQTEIFIEAPTEVVWQHLTDLAGYRDWNPFIVESVGDVAVGAKLTNRMQPPGGRAVTFKPTVTEVEAGRTFEWLGRLGLPGIFDG